MTYTVIIGDLKAQQSASVRRKVVSIRFVSNGASTVDGLRPAD
jgi:hypothetical protein